MACDKEPSTPPYERVHDGTNAPTHSTTARYHNPYICHCSPYIPVTRGTLSVGEPTVGVGDTHAFRAQWNAKNGGIIPFEGHELGYCNYDPALVQIDTNGVLTALAPGRTQVTICADVAKYATVRFLIAP